MQDDSYRVCIYGDDARAPGATIALAGRRHLPRMNGEGTGCGIDLRIAASPLPDDAATIAVVLAPYAGQFGELVPMACDERWIVREIDRSVLDAIGRVGAGKDPEVDDERRAPRARGRARRPTAADDVGLRHAAPCRDDCRR